MTKLSALLKAHKQERVPDAATIGVPAPAPMGTPVMGRHGRPRSLPKNEELKLDSDTAGTATSSLSSVSSFEHHDSEFGSTAFSVPDTPKFFHGPSFANSKVPFPAYQDESLRHSECEEALAPWSYLLSIPGKNVRDLLIDSFNVWLNVDKNSLDVVKQVVGYLHSASLIIDDIEDESMTRRGVPAAHVVHGVASSLNAGNYVYFLALEKLLQLQSTPCVEIYTAEMTNLHRGQGRDILWRNTSRIVSEEEYRQMVCDKTGGLFRLAIRIMQILSPDIPRTGSMSEMSRTGSVRPCLFVLAWLTNKKKFCEISSPGNNPKDELSAIRNSIISDFTSLSDEMACYFQIRDDLINLASPNFHKSKGFCEDITEGKFSFMVLHCLRTNQQKSEASKVKELTDILKMKTTNPVVIRRALKIMDETQSFAYTLKFLKDSFARMEAMIQELGGNKPLMGLLTKLAADLEDCNNVKAIIQG